MKRIKLLVLTLIACFFIGASTVNPITIYFIGDSTMADYDVNVYPDQRGWGQMFRQFLTGDINFVNAARNGRSSKSFYMGSDSLWANVRKKLVPGDYVMIQFAHNDEKDAGISGTDGIGTAPWDEYQTYLTKYVNEVRAAGAIPILVEPIVRCYFSGNTITRAGAHDLSTTADDSTLNYPRAMKAVARNLSVPLIDLTALTKTLAESYGAANAKSIIYLDTDNTHLKAIGATLYAQLFVQEMIRQNILTPYLNPSADMIVSPTTIDFGNCYVATYVSKTLSISGMNFTPASGTITVNAPDGFSVCATPGGTFTNSISIPYTGGNLSPTNVYLRFIPTVVKVYSDNVTISNPAGSPKTAAVTGNALPISSGISASILFPLTGDANPVITGPINSLGESWTGMYVKNYAVPSSTATWPAGAAGGTTQRNIIIGDAWPGGEIDIVTSRYVQFGIQPGTNTNFTIDSIGVFAGAGGGGSMGFRVICAKKSDFSDAVVLEDRITNTSNNMYALSYKPIIQVSDTEAFYLRFYPWYTVAATSKYLCLQNLAIYGKVNSIITKISNHTNSSNDMINVYPNPCKEFFNVNNPNKSQNTQIEIYNSLGKLCKNLSIVNNDESVDISDLSNGIYLLKFISENKSNTQVLIKD